MDKLRWGLIGCGDVARKRVASAIQDEPRSELVAACRRDQTKLREFCHHFGINRSYSRDEDLLRDPQIDAVYIATPVLQHLPQTVAAARAGKHVLVEKPMALGIDQCETMIAECQQAGVKLGVAYYRRYYPVVDRIVQLLQEGEIGKPMNVSAITATPPMQPHQDGYWRVSLNKGGGGALMDIGSHRIHLFQHLFGEIEQVKAICTTVAGDYEAEDTAVVCMKFRSGLTATLQCHFGCVTDPDELSILGTDGRLTSRPLNAGTLTVETTSGSRVEQLPPASNLCGPMLADFASAVLDDREPLVTGAHGRAANGVLRQAYTSASNNST